MAAINKTIHKLKRLGIGGTLLKCILSYLTGRQQLYVCIDSAKSEPFDVPSVLIIGFISRHCFLFLLTTFWAIYAIAAFYFLQTMQKYIYK